MYRIEYRRGYDNKETMIFFIDCVLINLLIIFIWKKLFSTLLNTLLLLSEDGFHIVKNIWTSELRAAGSQNCNLIIAETDRQYKGFSHIRSTSHGNLRAGRSSETKC